MSGESPPNISGRFTGLNNNSKKFSNTPKSPLLGTNTTGGNRNSQTRARLLSSKISAPRPINLPSLRREHAVGTDIPVANSPSSAPNHGWGTSSSPFTSPKENEIKPDEVASEPAKKSVDQQAEAPTSPKEETPTTVRAWAAPTVEHAVKPPSGEFPTAAEALAGKSNEKNEELDEDDKDYLKFIMSDPNHKSWDEMVAEDFEDDFTETMEFSELNKQTESNEVVSPSERFAEDYDRSYPPQLKQTRDNDNYKSFRNRNDDNYRYNNYENNNGRRYSSSEAGGGNERRHSNDRWNNSSNHRRDSADQKNVPGGGTWQRRPSYDRKSPYQPTLLQRNRRMSEHSARSDHSREDHPLPSPEQQQQQQQNVLQIITEPDAASENNPSEITAVQREVMMTAAERAKKRRDEEEAEYEAARERARQKAAALAMLAEAKEEEKKKPHEVTEILKNPDNDPNLETKQDSPPPPPSVPQQKEEEKKATPSPTIADVSKPWNLVAAKKNQTSSTPSAKPSTPEEEPKLSESTTTNTSSKGSTALTEDEQNWEKHVNEIRKNGSEPKSKHVTANDWTQYADRLQEKSVNKNMVHREEKPNVQVEVIDFQKNKSWGEIPSNITHGRGRRNEGWTIADEENKSHGRGRGRKTSASSTQRRKLSDSTDLWRQHPTKEPVVLEILKHSPPPTPVAVPKQVEEPECPKQKSVPTIADLLHDSPSPIFPLSIKRLVGKKPLNMSFMVDTEESDEEITMTTYSQKSNDSTPLNQNDDDDKQTDMKEDEDTTTLSDSAESSSNTSSPAVSHGQKMEEVEMQRMRGNSNFPVLIYQFPQNGDTSAHGYVTRPDGSQQRPVGVYLSPPQYVPGNQYMVPYPQAGTGNVQPIYFPTVSWQQQPQQRYNVHRQYDRTRPPYRSNRQDEDWKYQENYSGRGSYRKRGHYTAPRGRGHSTFYKKNTEFDHSTTTTTVQDP